MRCFLMTIINRKRIPTSDICPNKFPLFTHECLKAFSGVRGYKGMCGASACIVTVVS
jgi:hypothetical protein